jgi:hypothetical protein
MRPYSSKEAIPKLSRSLGGSGHKSTPHYIRVRHTKCGRANPRGALQLEQIAPVFQLAAVLSGLSTFASRSMATASADRLP